jgi:UDP-3-O-[3-hydroxymyristoyl] glucosamine N-acyltransferase
LKVGAYLELGFTNHEYDVGDALMEGGGVKKKQELAQWVNGTVVGDGEIEISGVAAIEVAQPGEITFIANPKYLPKLSQTHASAVIVSKEVAQADKSILCVTDPYLAFTKILLFPILPINPKGSIPIPGSAPRRH